MCFSAEASFGLATVLVPAGIYCVRTALRRNCSFLPLAVIPIIFGIQQAAEGFVWVGIHRSNHDLVVASSLTFLFFALCFWLVWVPFCLFFIERPGALKWFLGGVVLLGLTAGLILFAPLVQHPGVMTTRVMHHSIQYDFPPSPIFPTVPRDVRHAVYLAIVAVPILTIRSRQVLGFCIVLILSAVVSRVVYWYAFASVWCFFAAILSMYLCVIFSGLPAANVAPAVVPDRRGSARIAG